MIFRKERKNMKTTLNPFENAKRTAQGTGGSATIPPATADSIGGVKIGEGISVTEDGTISTSIINMTSNTDYLTNKVLNGKPVYMRYIDLEPSVGNRDVLTGVNNILSCNLRVVSDTKEISLPNYNLQYEGSFSWGLNTVNHKIEYTTSDNNTSYGMRGYIEYTKTGA